MIGAGLCTVTLVISPRRIPGGSLVDTRLAEPSRSFKVTMNRISVLIADDHMIVRQGLKHLLQTAADIQVVGEAQNGFAAVRETQNLMPKVVILDIAMPQLNGIDAARQIHRLVPSVGILM